MIKSLAELRAEYHATLRLQSIAGSTLDYTRLSAHAEALSALEQLDGNCYQIFDLFKPLLTDDADFVAKVDGNFDTVDETLAKYKEGDGYQTYDKLSEDDRRVLAGAVNTLAEDLSTLQGKLGL